MIKSIFSRRKFVRKCLAGGSILLTGGVIFSGCGSDQTAGKTQNNTSPDDPCGDLSGVPQSDIDKRKKLGYQKESPIQGQQCDNCNLYIPSKSEDGCGGCMLFKGPVHAEGYCTYWAPKT